MTKLTTERLEKLQDNLLQFQDAYSDPADKENYDIFVDALHVLDEFKTAKEKLIAYEQAAKNPVAFVDERSAASGGICWAKSGKRELPHGAELYAAPVLPKQPKPVVLYMGRELISKEGLELIRDGISEATNLESACMANTILGGSYHVQPVIPKWPSDEVERDALRYRFLRDKDFFGDEDEQGLVGWEGLVELSYNEFDAAVDARISHPNIDYVKLDTALRKHIPAQPVSEPHKLPDGWVMVPQQIFLDASDIESICSQCGDGHKSGYGDFTDGLLWVGDIQCDNGTIMHGLHISSSDYQEEGGLTLAEFKAPAQEQK